jgi:hypothetical protein
MFTIILVTSLNIDIGKVLYIASIAIILSVSFILLEVNKA